MILFNEKSNSFLIRAGEMSIALHVDEDRHLMCLWYGAKLTRFEDVPAKDDVLRRLTHGAPRPEQFAEYAGWSGELGGCEPACKAVFPNEARDLRFRYQSHVLKDDALRITLKDLDFDFFAHIEYRVYDDCSSVERTVTLENRMDGDVTLEQFCSGALHLPFRSNWRFTSLTGKWGDEYRITHAPLRDGQTVLQTRSIFSGADAVPFVAFDEGSADERGGAVWFANLIWSGTHCIKVEKNPIGDVSALLGINSYDCRIVLAKDEKYTLPTLTCGYTEQGFGGMSRIIHRYERNYIMDPFEAKRILPVVYNAYGTFYSDIDEQKIMSVIEPAHKLGIEALIIDAGWAGEGDNYQLGMGVWNENKQRFPSGIKAISDALHAKGMLFGLWMEPEVVHKDSPLVKEHPDWVFGHPDRRPDVLGNFRMVLNIGLDEVREYLTEKICHLIDSCGVDYFKIDFNRYLWETYSNAVEPKDRRSLWIKYVDNLCGMYMDVKKRYPELLFENCAAGGHRTDLSMLRFSGRINRSDNQDPLDVLTLHEGFSYVMPPKLAGGGCHISKVFTQHINERVSTMRFQAHTAMMGSLAVGMNLATITPEETAELKSYIELHKSIRETVQRGDIYRLASASNKPYAAFEYLLPDKSEAVLFVFAKSVQFVRIFENFRLEDLEKDALYDVEGFGTRTGQGLMKVGLKIVLNGDMDSRVIRIRKIK